MDIPDITGEVFLRLQRLRKGIVCNVSNRHAHLKKEDIEKLFGHGYRLKKLRDLMQPGEYACRETVTLMGPKSKIKRIRVLGPPREFSQVEISRTDAYAAGIDAQVRLSGDLGDTAGGRLIGPSGSVYIPGGIIVAARHIHMTPGDADFFKVRDGDRVRVRTRPPRSVVFEDVIVRVSNEYATECHIDRDEANCCDFKSSEEVFLT